MQYEVKQQRGVVAMKMPLDHICLKSGVLCPRCRKLVESGVVADYEVEIMRGILELEEKNPEFRALKDGTYIKSYRVDSFVVLMVEVPENVSTQTLTKLARALSEKLGMKIRVVKKVNDMKLVIAQIVAPARVNGVNSLWLPDGTVQHIVRISRYDAKLLPASIEALEKLFKEIFGEDIRIRLT